MSDDDQQRREGPDMARALLPLRVRFVIWVVAGTVGALLAGATGLRLVGLIIIAALVGGIGLSLVALSRRMRGL